MQDDSTKLILNILIDKIKTIQMILRKFYGTNNSVSALNSP